MWIQIIISSLGICLCSLLGPVWLGPQAETDKVRKTSESGGYCGTAESKLEKRIFLFHIIQLTAGFGGTAQRQFLGIFQKVVHSKGCFPNSKMDDVTSAIIFFLTVYSKIPPESLEPSDTPSIPHATSTSSTSHLLLEAHHSEWGDSTCTVSGYLTWTHTHRIVIMTQGHTGRN